MNKWNDHHELEGKHAFLGASQHSWLRWDEETLYNRFVNSYSSEIGTAIHELAHYLIINRIKLNRNSKNVILLWLSMKGFPRYVYDAEEILSNLEAFVNDSIYYHMSSEIILYYSKEAFGTTDAIRADERTKKLQIFDYKNGKNDASMEQLMIYAAFFFLEYKQFNPLEWTIELRIYQKSEITEYNPMPDEIIKIMSIIKDNVEKLQVMKGVTI